MQSGRVWLVLPLPALDEEEQSWRLGRSRLATA
jgi:hypothetical protein